MNTQQKKENFAQVECDIFPEILLLQTCQTGLSVSGRLLCTIQSTLCSFFPQMHIDMKVSDLFIYTETELNTIYCLLSLLYSQACQSAVLSTYVSVCVLIHFEPFDGERAV
jgi:hypothetical protein